MKLEYICVRMGGGLVWYLDSLELGEGGLYSSLMKSDLKDLTSVEKIKKSPLYVEITITSVSKT